VLDALTAHVAVLDAAGTIVATNAAWDRFAAENRGVPERVGVGCCYLAVCDAANGARSDEAPVVARALREILAGERDAFSLEYPCPSPTEERWFVVRATPLAGTGGAVVAHEPVTAQRRAERKQETLLTYAHEQADRLRKLSEATVAAAGSTELGGTLQTITESAARLLGAGRAATAVTVGTRPMSATYPPGTESEQGPWEDDPVEDEPAESQGLSAPLVGRDGRTVGHVRASAKANGGTFTAEDEAVLVQLAQTAAAAVENALLLENAREARREAEHERHRYREAFNHAPAFVAVLSGPEHRFVFANPAYRRLIGGRRVVGRPLLDALPEMSDQPFPALLDRVLATGERYVGREVRVLLSEPGGEVTGPAEPTAAESAPDGLTERYVDFVYEPVREADGSVTGIFVHGVDVTEQVEARRRIEALAAEAEAEARQLQAVLDVLPVTVFLADAEGRVVETNPAARALWGETPLVGPDEYARYKGWWPRSGERIAADDWALARVLRTGEAVLDEEVEIETFDGRRRSAINNALPIRDGEGRLVGAAVAMVDVTPLKRTQRELRRLNETLEARVAERTKQVNDLAAALTLAEQRERRRISQLLHDGLQQHLFGTRLQVGFLESSGLAGDEAAIRAQTERLEGLLDEAVQITRTLAIDLSPPVLENEGLEAALSWLVGHMRELHGLEVDLAVEGPCELPGLERRVLLFHLVRELLFNVVKHAGTGAARVEVTDEGERVRICVEDEGAGFDVEPAARAPGEGFGLYSVRERLGLFGGTFEVDSQPGRGTCATITIPKNGT
jgi:PAS domain S-box-containing protein